MYGRGNEIKPQLKYVKWPTFHSLARPLIPRSLSCRWSGYIDAGMYLLVEEECSSFTDAVISRARKTSSALLNNSQRPMDAIANAIEVLDCFIWSIGSGQQMIMCEGGGVLVTLNGYQNQ